MISDVELWKDQVFSFKQKGNVRSRRVLSGVTGFELPGGVAGVVMSRSQVCESGLPKNAQGPLELSLSNTTPPRPNELSIP